MRFVSFFADGRASYGIAHRDGVFDLGARFGTVLPDLKSFLHARALGLTESLPSVSGVDYCSGEFSYRRVIGNPDKILCVGLNYATHIREMGRDLPTTPTLFSKLPRALTDPFATISQGGTWLNQQWLSELAFFRVSQAIGPTGLTVLYAVLITAPLALLLWICRRKGTGMLVAVAAFYFPGVLAVIHPRAAGFTVLIFTLLVGLLVVLWRERGGAGSGRRGAWWAPLAILALFALWANLHGGFIAGLLFWTWHIR